MKIVLNLANKLYVLEDEWEGQTVYRLSSTEDEVVCNEDEAYEQRMSGEVYRLLLEEFGAKTYYYQTRPSHQVVDEKRYVNWVIGRSRNKVLADSYFKKVDQAVTAAQFIFELFTCSKSRCESYPYGDPLKVDQLEFYQRIRWEGLEFVLFGPTNYQEGFPFEINFEEMGIFSSEFSTYLLKSDVIHQVDETRFFCQRISSLFVLIANYLTLKREV